jgi:hypothetical protein
MVTSVHEWRLIEGSFDFDEMLQRDQVAIDRIGEAANMTTQERQVLDAIDGTRTVRQIVDQNVGQLLRSLQDPLPVVEFAALVERVDF